MRTPNKYRVRNVLNSMNGNNTSFRYKFINKLLNSIKLKLNIIVYVLNFISCSEMLSWIFMVQNKYPKDNISLLVIYALLIILFYIFLNYSVKWFYRASSELKLFIVFFMLTTIVTISFIYEFT